METLNIAHRWSDFILTDKGLALRNQIIAEKLDVMFSKVQIGEGKPASPEAVATLTGLVIPKENAKLKKSYAQGADHSFVITIDNKDYENGIMVTEVGVFATLVTTGQEILYGYAYCVTGGVEIPAIGVAPRIHELVFSSHIDRDYGGEIIYDGSAVYVTAEDLDDHDKDVGAHPYENIAMPDVKNVAEALNFICDKNMSVFVSPEGNDETGKGTRENPFGTIKYALYEHLHYKISSPVPREMRIFLDEGVHIINDSINVTFSSGVVAFRSYPGAITRPIIRITSTIDFPFTIAGSSEMHVSNLIFEGNSCKYLLNVQKGSAGFHDVTFRTTNKVVSAINAFMTILSFEERVVFEGFDTCISALSCPLVTLRSVSGTNNNIGVRNTGSIVINSNPAVINFADTMYINSQNGVVNPT